jgi:protein-S-isoprenylcysteine O-methyltransferase Ste14
MTEDPGTGGIASDKGPAKPRNPVLKWLSSTSKRTFVLYPLLVIGYEFAMRRGDMVFMPWGLPLLAWGYLQYRWGGIYRTRHGGGGPGLDVPPDRIVTEGIFKFTRNPMYLGHLIFMTGLVATFFSGVAVAILVWHIFWFHYRVKGDEEYLEERFGADYRAYKARVKRWIPYVI